MPSDKGGCGWHRPRPHARTIAVDAALPGAGAGGAWRRSRAWGPSVPLPFFVSHGLSKKNRKDWGFFFPWLCCFGYRWYAVWGLLPLLPHCGKGTVAPCTGGFWWQGGAVGVPIAPTAAFRGTPFLQHRGSLLCLVHELFEAFPLHFYFMERLQICFHPQQNHPIPGPWVCVVPRDPKVGVPLGRGCREGRVSTPLAPSPCAAPGAGPIWPLPLPMGPPCKWLLQNLPQNSPIPSP